VAKSKLDDKTSSQTILFVDDELILTKWFKKTFETEFNIVCANNADEALMIINSPNHNIGVVVTDYKMPNRNGLELLQEVLIHHPTIIKVLISGFADKSIMLEAINSQLVFRMLEKPLDIPLVRQTLKAAQQAYVDQVGLTRSLENGLRGMRESLGFLVHELSSPLAIISTYIGMLGEANNSNQSDQSKIQTVITSAQRNIKFCQNLVSSFSQNSRESYALPDSKAVSAATLIQLFIREFPYKGRQESYIKTDLGKDFVLPKVHSLIYLCLSTVIQNAFRELDRPEVINPYIMITLGSDSDTDPTRKDNCWIAIADNGLGISVDVKSRLLINPVTTYEGRGGNGMGLLFCKKVMLSLAGNISVETRHADNGFKAGSTGTTVKLHFQSDPQKLISTSRYT
jgi:two-component system, response regulator PhcR